MEGMAECEAFYKEQSPAWSRQQSRLPRNRPGHNNARQKKIQEEREINKLYQ
jgi:hypothetical protein